MSVLQRLTEGVQSRDMQAEGQALLNKWEATGLLEGLSAGQAKQGMAVLLENQAKELLREASSMAAGDVEGFAAVAFPIVRRVFGGLIANDLVSVQPMSLPSGLIFFLDFSHTKARLGAGATESVYGGNKLGKEIQEGVDLEGADASGPGGHYEVGHSHSSAPGSATVAGTAQVSLVGTNTVNMSTAAAVIPSAVVDGKDREVLQKAIRYDADLQRADIRVQIVDINIPAKIDRGRLGALELAHPNQANASLIRRLTSIVSGKLRLVYALEGQDFSGNGAANGGVLRSNELDGDAVTFVQRDEIDNVGSAAPGALLAGTMVLEEPGAGISGAGGAQKASGGKGGSENTTEMSEIDIKVDSIAVTATTKKLKAKWSPELGQDLNAYHNLDAEVELTGILSEQIALEIDRELLHELVEGATAGTRYWSRSPGLFVDSSGAEVGHQSAAPDFTGTVSEWYETLIETINDVSAQIHRKTLRGGANFVVCSPEVANILEFTSGFRASVTADQDRGTIGAIKSGSLSKKFDVYVDPYFLRNVLLVGRKGSSFLESGFVYAPYVPLQVTPTIFGTEDFVPRKGVMTRYAKKMVRPDMYGLVVVRGLLGESGRSS